MTADRAAWAALAARELKGNPAESLTWETPEGIQVRPLYAEDDLAGLSHLGVGIDAVIVVRRRIHLIRSLDRVRLRLSLR